MKPDVTLVYDPECPNVGAARAALTQAFLRIGRKPQWRERAHATTDGHPSPTIRIDGVAVGGEAGDPSAASCRLYADGAALSGAPAVDTLVAALTQASEHDSPA